MLPDPLHPAIVHMPVALALLLPLLALLAHLTIARQFFPPRVWTGIVLLQALLALSGWYAMETGEDQEDRVERVLEKTHIEEHEEAAERFTYIAAAVIAVAAAGLLPGRVGHLARGGTVVATIAVLVASFLVGRSGGDLVYKYGAAKAYTQQGGAGAAPGAGGEPQGFQGSLDDDEHSSEDR